MGRIILGIYPTAVRVVVFDNILKNTGKEVVAFGKSILKRGFYQFIHQRSGKRCFLCIIRYIVRQFFKKWNLCVVDGLRRKNVNILISYVHHRTVKDEIKITLGLLVPKV